VTSRHLRRKTSLIVSNLSPFFWQLNFCKWEQRQAVHDVHCIQILGFWNDGNRNRMLEVKLNKN
jgi:hypothetical protein